MPLSGGILKMMFGFVLPVGKKAEKWRGEGWRVYFKLYIIFFILWILRFLTLGSFFRFLPLPFTRIYIKEFSTLHPSPFCLIFCGSESLGWRVVKGGEGRSKKTFHSSMKKTALKIWKLQIFSVSLQKIVRRSAIRKQAFIALAGIIFAVQIKT